MLLLRTVSRFFGSAYPASTSERRQFNCLPRLFFGFLRHKFANMSWLSMLLIGVASTAFALASMRIKDGGISFPRAKDSTITADGPTLLEGGGPNSETAIKSEDRLEAEIITILPTGFEPDQITRPAGPFILAVENRSGVKQVDFQLEVEKGARVFQVTRSWKVSDWNQVINPPPGRYVLTERNHPAWNCLITITTK